jgi:hypothetical protein
MRALNLMEDILSTYYKCTLLAITHKLNASGHMLIWTFFLFWYVELVPRMCPHLSVTPCISYFSQLTSSDPTGETCGTKGRPLCI